MFSSGRDKLAGVDRTERLDEWEEEVVDSESDSEEVSICLPELDEGTEEEEEEEDRDAEEERRGEFNLRLIFEKEEVIKKQRRKMNRKRRNLIF